MFMVASRFRWAACHLDYLCELPHDRARRKALDSLPPSLNETYERILQRVNKQGPYARTLVRRTLCWTLFAEVPLRIEALQEALSIEEDLTSVDPSNKPDVRKIIKYCSSLIRRSVDGRYLELAHFTVEEYLLGLPEVFGGEASYGSDTAFYHLNAASGDLYLAVACLRYLNYEDFGKGLPQTYDEWQRRIDQYPFREHAVTHLSGYARKNWANEVVMSLARKIFQPAKTPNFLSFALDFCILEHGYGRYPKDLDSREEFSRFSLPILMHGMSPLHCATMFQAPPLVDWLLTAGCDPNTNESTRFSAFLCNNW